MLDSIPEPQPQLPQLQQLALEFAFGDKDVFDYPGPLETAMLRLPELWGCTRLRQLRLSFPGRDIAIEPTGWMQVEPQTLSP